MSTLERMARNYALLNAYEHGGKANAKSVMGKLIAWDETLRDDIPSLGRLAGKICGEISKLSVEEQEKELMEHAPELLEPAEKEESGLSPLPDSKDGVVMRLAPNPSGPLHLGHTRMAILNDEFVRMHGGKLILRLEDTNPHKVLPDAYEMIKQDLEWLGVAVHETVIQSERFELYYKIAEELIRKGKAYACSCPSEEWRKRKSQGKPCKHRDETPQIHMERWTGMLDGAYAEGAISLVVKTDIEHKNPAVRDFVAFRIVDSVDHPLTGDRYRVYPLMNFSVAADDHLLGLTHVLRGKDHLNNTIRQGYMYDHLGWKKPIYFHYGWVSITDTVLKTTTALEGIREGTYSGWDDPQLGTVRALARRGIDPEAIRRVWVETGLKDVDISFSWENLYSHNKNIIEPKANRLFFVPDPFEMNIVVPEKEEMQLSNHPKNEGMGKRTIRIGKPPHVIVVPSNDVSNVPFGGHLRLKDLCNVVRTETGFEHAGNDVSLIKKGIPIVQWAPSSGEPLELLYPDGTTVRGIIEDNYLDHLGEVVQLERCCFARLEKGKALFTHK